MKIVIITGNQPEHHYVANTLTAQFSVDAILVCDPPARRTWKSLLKKNPILFINKAARKAFLQIIRDASDRKTSLEKIFGEYGREFAKLELVQHVGRPKDGRLSEMVAKLSPDILAIYGTGIIPKAVLNMTKVVALNMHTGISPYYRGVSCTMWPILDQRPEMIGATVHECTAVVDGGKIYFCGRATLSGNEALHEVFAKAVLTGANGYAQVINEFIECKAIGVPQDLSDGQEYNGMMIGFISELRARLALRKLRRNNMLKTAGEI